MKIAEMTKGELAERLILSVLNTDECKDRLLNFPHIEKGSFSLVVQLCLGEKNLEGKYTSCITVTNDILNGWDNSLRLSKDEMFSMAIENSKKLFPIMIEPLENFLGTSGESKDVSFKTDGINLPYCLVLTNTDFYNGAAAMFYEPDALGKIAGKLKADSLYLLPSSTNHIFCIPHSSALSKDEIKDIFSTLVSQDDEDRLSDKILSFDAGNKMIAEPDGVTYFPALDVANNVHQGMDGLNHSTRR